MSTKIERPWINVIVIDNVNVLLCSPEIVFFSLFILSLWLQCDKSVIIWRTNVTHSSSLTPLSLLHSALSNRSLFVHSNKKKGKNCQKNNCHCHPMTRLYANHLQSLELWHFTLYFWIKPASWGNQKVAVNAPGEIPNNFLGLASRMCWDKWMSQAEQMHSKRWCSYRRGNVPGEHKQGGVRESWSSCWISGITLHRFRTDRWNVWSNLAWQEFLHRLNNSEKKNSNEKLCNVLYK